MAISNATGLLILLLCGAEVGTARTPPTAKDVDRAVRQLSDDRFVVRQQAMELLWRAGPSAEPALRNAGASPDAEVRHRAQWVLDQIKFGITPETPAEIVEVIQRYRAGETDVKIEALQELLQKRALRAVATLLKLEGEKDVRRNFMLQLGDTVPTVVQPLLMAGEFSQAEELLAFAAQSEPAMPHYAAFLLQRNVLDDRISVLRERLAKTPEPSDATLLVYLLRAKGDLPAAAAAAKRAKSSLVYYSVLFEMGDWRELARLHADWPRNAPEDWVNFFPTSDSPNLLAVLHHWSGNTDARDKLLEKIKADGEGSAEAAWSSGQGLLFCGRVDDGIQLMARHDRTAAFRLLCGQFRFREAFSLVGIQKLDGPHDTWFKRQIGQLKRKPGDDPNPSDDPFRVALQVARQLHRLGQTENAKRGLVLLAKAVSKDEDPSRLHALVEVEVQLGLRDEALDHAARALEKDDTAPLHLLFPQKTEGVAIWFEFLKQQRGDLSRKAMLRELRNLVDPAVDETRRSHKELEDLAARMERTVSDQEPLQRAPWWHEMGETCLRHGDRPLAIACFEKAAKFTAASAMKLGDLFAEDQSWLAAADWYGRAWETEHQPAALFFQGRALVESGDVRGVYRKDSALLIPLAADSRSQLAEALEKHGLPAEGRLQRELLLRTGFLPAWHVQESAQKLGAATTTDPAVAARCWAQMLCGVVNSELVLSEAEGHLEIPFLIHRARARAALAQGDFRLAGSEIERSLAILPGDVRLAEDIVPELEKAGRAQEADELFQKVFALNSAACQAFPRSPEQLNNTAWLAARCQRELDKALDYSQRAVALLPNNSAYLDTLAEVHFRRGNRGEAARLEQRCLEIEPRNAFFREQLARFQAGS